MIMGVTGFVTDDIKMTREFIQNICSSWSHHKNSPTF
jgi:hypothetical protein